MYRDLGKLAALNAFGLAPAHEVDPLVEELLRRQMAEQDYMPQPFLDQFHQLNPGAMPPGAPMPQPMPQQAPVQHQAPAPAAPSKPAAKKPAEKKPAEKKEKSEKKDKK